jgi:hypothetical protein
MSSLSRINAKAAETMARMSANERRLLGGLLLVVLAAAPIKAASMRQEAAARNETVQAELERVRQATGRAAGGVATELTQQRAEVRNWSWQAESVEVGKVLVQDRISTMADTAGLTDVDVKVADKTEPVADIQLVPLTLTANFSWAGLSGFVAAMDAAGKGFILDSVEMPDNDKPRLKVELRAPLYVRPARPEAAT